MRRATSVLLAAPVAVAASRGMYAYALVALVSSLASLQYWTAYERGEGETASARKMLHLDRAAATVRACYAATLVAERGSRAALALGAAALATYAAKQAVWARATADAARPRPRMREAAVWLHVAFHVLCVATELAVLCGL